MANVINTAIGLEKQFRPIADSVYQKKLNSPEYGRNYNGGRDIGAESFARSLGVLGDAIWKNHVAHETREMNQLTLEKAKAMVAGKTAQDLKDFDVMSALQHSDTGYDLSDNKYAVALLERSMGMQAANDASLNFLKDHEGEVFKSPEQAVQIYQSYLQDAQKAIRGNIQNDAAFDDGLNTANFENSFKVAEVARKTIKQDRQEKIKAITATNFQKLLSNTDHAPTMVIKDSMGSLVRTTSLAFDNVTQCREFWKEQLRNPDNAKLIKDSAVLDALMNTEFFPGGHKLSEEIPTGNIRKNISVNVTRALADKALNNPEFLDKNGIPDEAKIQKWLTDEVGSMRTAASGGKLNVSTGNPNVDSLIYSISATEGVDPKQMFALFMCEHSGGTDATSYNKLTPNDDDMGTYSNADVGEGEAYMGARGPFQVIAATAKRFGVTNYSSLEQHITAAVKYYKYLLNEFKDPSLAAAHYNCGEGGDINNEETANYKVRFDKFLKGIGVNPDYGKTLIPRETKIEFDNDSVEQRFNNSALPVYKKILPNIIGKLCALGVEEPVVTSSYREPGEAGTAGSKSDHTRGDALDIWIGEGLTQEQGDAIAAQFAPYFSQVLFERKGNPETGATGDHMHLGHYIGGLENQTTNMFDYNQTAFSNTMVEDAMQLVRQQANYKKQQLREVQANEKQEIVAAMLNNGDWKTLMDKSHLGAGDKATMIYRNTKRIEAEKRAEEILNARKAKANMSPEEAWHIKYFTKGQYFEDNTRLEMYRAKWDAYKEENNDPTASLEDALSPEEYTDFKTRSKRYDPHMDWAMPGYMKSTTGQYGWVRGNYVGADYDRGTKEGYKRAILGDVGIGQGITTEDILERGRELGDFLDSDYEDMNANNDY